MSRIDRGGNTPNSMAQIPVPVPMSKTCLAVSAPGFKARAPSSVITYRWSCRSDSVSSSEECGVWCVTESIAFHLGMLVTLCEGREFIHHRSGRHILYLLVPAHHVLEVTYCLRSCGDRYARSPPGIGEDLIVRMQLMVPREAGPS